MREASHRIQLVQHSWRAALPLADQITARFYEKLFELDPNLRGLFRGDLQVQQCKWADMLNALVQGLDHRTELLAVVGLAQRHVHYGVKEVDHETAGTALIWALGECLGDQFTPEVRSAWVETYGYLACLILKHYNPSTETEASPTTPIP